MALDKFLDAVSFGEYSRSKMEKDPATKTKRVVVDGVSYDLPAGFDESIISRELQLEKQIGAGLVGEEKAAQDAVGAVEQQEQSSVDSLRCGAAEALATQRGLVEGGRGLALARGTVNEAATKEAQFRSSFAEQVSNARQNAAAARTQRLVEEGKLLSAEKERMGGAAKAQASINEIKNRFEGTIYTSGEDYKNAAAELDALAASTTNPVEAQAYKAAANKARRGQL